MSTAALAVDSPVGRLALQERDGAIVALGWGPAAPAGGGSALLAEAAAQLRAYFARELADFDLPLMPAGSPFENAVWEQMRRIAYGETRTYGTIAAATDGSARAVGTACGRNPIPILIPCHRVVAAQGRLGGYSGAGGVATKRALLELEGAFATPLFPAESRPPGR